MEKLRDNESDHKKNHAVANLSYEPSSQLQTISPPVFQPKVKSSEVNPEESSEREFPHSEYQFASGAEDDSPSSLENQETQIDTPFQLKTSQTPALQSENGIQGASDSKEKESTETNDAAEGICLILTQGNNIDQLASQLLQNKDTCEESAQVNETDTKEEFVPDFDFQADGDQEQSPALENSSPLLLSDGQESESKDYNPTFDFQSPINQYENFEQDLRPPLFREESKEDLWERQYKSKQEEQRRKKAQNLAESRARIRALQDAWIMKHPDQPKINGVIPQSEEHAVTLRNELQKNRYHKAWEAERKRVKSPEEKARMHKYWRQDMLRRGKGPELAKWDYEERQRKWREFKDRPTDDPTDFLLFALSGALLFTPAGPIVTGLSAVIWAAQGADMIFLGDDDLEINGHTISKKWRGRIYNIASVLNIASMAKNVIPEALKTKSWKTKETASLVVNFFFTGHSSIKEEL